MDAETQVAELRDRIEAQVARYRKDMEKLARLLSRTVTAPLPPVYHDD
jgi:hypothetical protein